MKSLREYLTESAKRYDFRIKIACDCTEKEDKLKSMLERFSVAEFKKAGITPIQELPLDFPKLRNREVTIYEVSLAYPTTQFELTEYIATGLGLAGEEIAVRKPGEPLEEYQQQVEQREDPLLLDPNYKEAGTPKFEEYYGEKYNASFLKSLQADAQERRKERGEQIPTAVESKSTGPNDTNSLPQNNTSVLNKVAQDPRKK